MKISFQNSCFRNTYFFFAVLLFLFTSKSWAQGEVKTISNCFSTSNFVELSNYFDEEIKLTIEKNEETVSKEDAEQRLRRFFSKNPIKSFKVIHESGSTNKLKYFIGNASSSSSNYRTYILYKQENGKFLISEVRIEAEK